MNVLRETLQTLSAQAERDSRPAGPWRLDFHLAPPVGWLNDPNGLCYFQGEYHVFYQYSPFDPEGGLRFWGHCKSKDLLSWERCPIMLCPDQAFDLHGAYSGSALCEEDGMYLFYTGTVKHEGSFDYISSGRESNTVLAWSPDGERLGWKRLLMRNSDYPEDLTLHVRDPKVWKQDGVYYMVQGARTKEGLGVALVFESPDKLQWRYINTICTPEPFGYMWECPDLFEIDGQWVLLVSPQGVQQKKAGYENKYACGYFPLLGDFRGGCVLEGFVPLDFGFDFYAPQTFSAGDRRLLCAWMGMPDADYTNPTVKDGWQHCLTVFRELGYANGRLYMRPVREVDALRSEPHEYCFSGRQSINIPKISDIRITCDGSLSLELSGVLLKAEEGNLTLAIQEGGYGRGIRSVPVKELRELRILVDASAIEIFANDGEISLSSRWYPEDSKRTLTLSGKGRALVCGLRPMRVKELPALA